MNQKKVINGCFEFDYIEESKNLRVFGQVLDYCFRNQLLEKVLIRIYYDVDNREQFFEKTFIHPNIPQCFITDIEHGLTKKYEYKSCN